METKYLSYLMGAENITDEDITALGVNIEETKQDGERTLTIPEDTLPQYIELIKNKLNNGFWNEIVGSGEIIFIFKFKDGSVKEYYLTLESEHEISPLCSEFSNTPLDKTANVYKYISDNKFYHDFMMEHYLGLINRK